MRDKSVRGDLDYGCQHFAYRQHACGSGKIRALSQWSPVCYNMHSNYVPFFLESLQYKVAMRESAHGFQCHISSLWFIEIARKGKFKVCAIYNVQYNRRIPPPNHRLDLILLLLFHFRWKTDVSLARVRHVLARVLYVIVPYYK
jgi:hypothetical protein